MTSGRSCGWWWRRRGGCGDKRSFGKNTEGFAEKHGGKMRASTAWSRARKPGEETSATTPPPQRAQGRRTLGTPVPLRMTSCEVRGQRETGCGYGVAAKARQRFSVRLREIKKTGSALRADRKWKA